jgi:hypothetical protein
MAKKLLLGAGLVCGCLLTTPGQVHAQAAQNATAVPSQLSALAPANLQKTRAKAPFDLTGTWQHDGRANTWRFVPETFKLTAAAQAHYERGVQALKDGGVYRDDIGQCWPAGLPLIMTRVWPIAMIQLPTAIYMVSGFMNSMRIIYLDGRPHTDPDIVVRTFNGESIGKWEGDTLVVDTKGFNGKAWLDQGGKPATDALHVIERFRRKDFGHMEIQITIDDPKAYTKPWTVTEPLNLLTGTELMEFVCNENNRDLEHLPGR